MKKFIFLVSIVFMALTGYLQAQNIQEQSVKSTNTENQKITNQSDETQVNTVNTNQQVPQQALQAVQTTQTSQASQAPIINDVSAGNNSVNTATTPLNQAAQSNSAVTNAVQNAPLQTSHVSQGVDQHSALSADMSMMGMYRQAHPVVKAVMIGLFLASIVTWTILVAKGFELFIAKRRAKSALTDIIEAKSLAALVQRFENNTNIGAYMVRMTEKEVKASLVAIDSAGNEGLKERVASQLAQIQSHASRRMARGTAIVATIGSIGPFVGLFGTVWGIMNSFIGIAQTKTTNLAVVAPGIAEALLATAIGLAAAIPAVVIYNILVRWIGGYKQNLSDCSLGIERLVSRDLDLRKAHRHHDERVAFAAE